MNTMTTMKIQARMLEIFLAQLEASACPPQRAQTAISRDRKIKELKECFEANLISLDECVRGMSAHTNI